MNLSAVKIARWIFALAALWGAVALVPGLFGEAAFNAAMPPAITHPEFYYGFHGVALVFQLVFVLIAIDPRRYRPLMPIAMLEKAAFLLPTLWLWQQGRVEEGGPLYGALIDGFWLLMFVLAWCLTRSLNEPGS